MQWFDFFTWLVTALSLWGTILNVQRNRVCFTIWIFTNAAWCVIDFWFGIYAQSCLHLTYLGLAIWGVFSWREKVEKA